MKVLRYILFPLALLYGLITWVRNVAFSVGILSSKKFDIPIIAVGNLNVGGTGKTPQIEYLINLLYKTKQVAVVSRGYGRKSKGMVVANQNSTADILGDEPYQFFRKFKSITVMADGNRVRAINHLQKQFKPQVVLLDDAFQHRKVKAGHYILLTAYNDLYKDDLMLPTGNLREPSWGAKRAHTVIVTKCPAQLSADEQERIKQKLQLNNQQQLFFSCIAYDENVVSANRSLSLKALKGKSILVVTGIAKSNPFIEFLTSQQLEVKHLSYPDHHNFNTEEIKEIVEQFRKGGYELILTTEKDYVRSFINEPQEVFYLPIKTHFISKQDKFDKIILDYVQ